MSNVPTCCFLWRILNPFVPWRNVEATFYHGYPTTTQWRVIIQPLARGLNYWRFLVSLEFDTSFDHRDEIVTDTILVFINLNGNTIEKKEVSHYSFNRRNRYKYHLETIAVMPPQMVPHHLIVEIEISLPRQDALHPTLIFDKDDLIGLSEDLNKLKIDRVYSNMKLLSFGNGRNFTAHSYILDARWNNFFKLHHLPTTSTHYTVETNISDGLLFDILTYMYSGVIPVSWPDWTDASYFPELFQVIDRYKLYNLYKVFVSHDSRQVRETRNSVFTESRIFPLERVNHRQINDASHTWNIRQNPGYEFIFQIHVRNGNGAGPWLSYSLESKASFRVFTQVNLELVRRVQPRNQRKIFRRLRSVHECDYTIDSNESVVSGPVLFLGCLETFGYFNPTRRPGPGGRPRYLFRCILHFTDGTTGYLITNFDGKLQDNLERFKELSDDMYKLLILRNEADLRIISPTEDPDVDWHDRFHKGIFATRVPLWREVFENIQHVNDLPDIVTSTLKAEVLFFVLQYIYTGKVFLLPNLFLDMIQDYAERSRFDLLLSLVNSFR